MTFKMDRLAGLDLQGILGLVEEGARNDRLRNQVRTFLNDNPSGDPHKIDEGMEAYSLAQFLTIHYPQALQVPIPGAQLETYRARFQLPEPARQKRIRWLEVETRGTQLRTVSEERKNTYWKEHFTTNKRHILEATQELDKRKPTGQGETDPKKRPVVMVLGAGSCADIPLEELAKKYRVVLVDIDEASMKVAMAQLPKNLHQYVSYEVRDLSGGAIFRLSQEVDPIIQTATTGYQAVTRIQEVFAKTPIPVPVLEGTERADLLISSMLVSQIPTFLIEATNQKLGAKFGTSPHQDRDFMAAASQMAGRMHDAHAEALRDFVVRSGGVAYYSSDIANVTAYKTPAQEDYQFDVRSTVPILLHQGDPFGDIDVVFRGDPDVTLARSYESWFWHEHPPELTGKRKLVAVDVGGETLLMVDAPQGESRMVDAVVIATPVASPPPQGPKH